MGDAFHSSRYSIEHAKRHIANLTAEIGAWVNSHPYAAFVETNPEGTQDTHKMGLAKPLPPTLPGIAADITNNLRSALDQAGFAVAHAAGQSGKYAKFPFGDNTVEVQSRIKSQSRDVPKEIFDVMVALQPYKGGNDLLWALNKICNTNKHEIFVSMPLVTEVGAMHIGNARVFGLTIWPPRWNAAKNEMVIMTVAHGDKPNYNLQFRGAVVIGNIERVGGQPALAVFNGMLAEVERCIMAIEAEAARIGIVPPTASPTTS